MSKESGANETMKQRNRITVILAFVIAPATILAGAFLLDDRKYYFVSLMVILYSMVPLFLKFERRKPEARELLLVAVMTAIAVAGRAAFFMLPQFKPVIAIVIIAGVALGGEVGFLVGAMTALVSNFFFGMGPFTPWQMFSLGIIGLLAGLLAEKGLLHKTKKALCLFGGLSTFFLFGGIMDFSSVLMWSQELTWELIATTYAAGLPFNLMHTGATIVFLYFFSNPLIDKLDRVVTKYGLLGHRM